jgi:hypothetical protein
VCSDATITPCTYNGLVDENKNMYSYKMVRGVEVRIILKWIFMKLDGEAWTGLTWLSIWTGGGHMRMQ